MKIRSPLKQVVRDMSVTYDLSVDTILEEAIVMWVGAKLPSDMKRTDSIRAPAQSTTTREFVQKARIGG